MSPLPKISTTRAVERKLEQLSPFELKDKLIALADVRHRHYQSSMLNAGRGNPNWTATAAREAFFALGQMAMAECRANMLDPAGLGGVPVRNGIAKRFWKALQAHKDKAGVEWLSEIYKLALKRFKGEMDDLIFEMVEGVTGCQYPEPVRMLPNCERIVKRFLLQELCGDKDPDTYHAFDLFATEGGTAAMCYIFDSLVENFLLKRGDRIAIGTPAFTPYIEIPQLEKYNFEVVRIEGSGVDAKGVPTYQYPDAELDKLGDPSIKAFFIINPTNPTSVMMSGHARSRLADVVRERNPNLMILTDDVYGTFVDGFVSLMDVLPRNTLTVYSFSKYFGCTGWRLGVIALARDNIYDDMLAALPTGEKERLARMYGPMTLDPGKLLFIDRLAANSRDVALNHTAGLSTPQQVQMALFAAFALGDKQNHKSTYKRACNSLVRKRYNLLWEAVGIPVVPDPDRADYYSIFDLQRWAVETHGQEFFDWLKENFEPVDLVFRLAEECSVVLLNGGGFAGPEWSVRVSLANLDNADYTTIGHITAAILGEYVSSWEHSRTY
jgi:aspartate 4-decarboxylase